MHDGNIVEAINRYSKAIELNPNLSKAHYNLATAYLTQAEQHFHYFSATANDETQHVKLYELMGAIEKFSSPTQQDQPDNLDPLDGLADVLATKN